MAKRKINGKLRKKFPKVLKPRRNISKYGCKSRKQMKEGFFVTPISHFSIFSEITRENIFIRKILHVSKKVLRKLVSSKCYLSRKAFDQLCHDNHKIFWDRDVLWEVQGHQYINSPNKRQRINQDPVDFRTTNEDPVKLSTMKTFASVNQTDSGIVEMEDQHISEDLNQQLDDVSYSPGVATDFRFVHPQNQIISNSQINCEPDSYYTNAKGDKVEVRIQWQPKTLVNEALEDHDKYKTYKEGPKSVLQHELVTRNLENIYTKFQNESQNEHELELATVPMEFGKSDQINVFQYFPREQLTNQEDVEMLSVDIPENQADNDIELFEVINPCEENESQLNVFDPVAVSMKSSNLSAYPEIVESESFHSAKYHFDGSNDSYVLIYSEEDETELEDEATETPSETLENKLKIDNSCYLLYFEAEANQVEYSESEPQMQGANLKTFSWVEVEDAKVQNNEETISLDNSANRVTSVLGCFGNEVDNLEIDPLFFTQNIEAYEATSQNVPSVNCETKFISEDLSVLSPENLHELKYCESWMLNEEVQISGSSSALEKFESLPINHEEIKMPGNLDSSLNEDQLKKIDSAIVSFLQVCEKRSEAAAEVQNELENTQESGNKKSQGTENQTEKSKNTTYLNEELKTPESNYSDSSMHNGEKIPECLNLLLENFESCEKIKMLENLESSMIPQEELKVQCNQSEKFQLFSIQQPIEVPETVNSESLKILYEDLKPSKSLDDILHYLENDFAKDVEMDIDLEPPENVDIGNEVNQTVGVFLEDQEPMETDSILDHHSTLMTQSKSQISSAAGGNRQSINAEVVSQFCDNPIRDPLNVTENEEFSSQSLIFEPQITVLNHSNQIQTVSNETELSQIQNSNIIVHNDIKCFICEFCLKSFDCQESLDAHKTYNINENVITCPELFQDFKPDLSTVCEICDQKLKNEYFRKKHNERHHSMKKLYFCCKCERSFTFKQSLDQHIENFCKENVMQKSKIAGKKRTQKKRFRYDPKPMYTCLFCKRQFWSKLNFSIHQSELCCGKFRCLRDNQVYKEKEKMRCLWCQQGFPTRFDLKIHLYDCDKVSLKQDVGRNLFTKQIYLDNQYLKLHLLPDINAD